MAAPPSAAPFQATAILPDRANPSVFARVNVPLTAGGVSRLVAGGLGWLLTFWNRPSQVLGSSQTDPSVQPVDFPNPSDGALAVGVCLPQNGAMNQYWVCITDSQPWMQLQVDEWTILFMKLGN